MNGENIERAVRRRVRRFDGVCAAERLPNDPCLLVCNTDPSHRLSEHWVVSTSTTKDDIANISIPLADPVCDI